MEVINTFDTLVSPIDWLIPQGKSLFKTLTSEKMQRRVRAIVLFLSVLVLLFIVGVVKTIQISLQLAYQEFESALRELELIEILNFQESEPVEEILNAQKTDDTESAPTQQLFEIRGFDRSEKKPAICEFCTDLILKS